MIPKASHYATDANLRARQRLWQHLEPSFDLFGWVIDLAGVGPGSCVLDVGCGNGTYLQRLSDRGVSATGCDLSFGMLDPTRECALVNADAQLLPFCQDSFDFVLAAHMLYHVPDRRRAVSEMKRVLKSPGPCVVVTNGSAHIESLRQLVESVVQPSMPGWKMVDWATTTFSLDTGGAILEDVFDTVELVRPPVTSTVVITDADVVADYIASVADAYEDQVAEDWGDVVEATRQAAQDKIDRHGRITTSGETGAFVCR